MEQKYERKLALRAFILPQKAQKEQNNTKKEAFHLCFFCAFCVFCALCVYTATPLI
jgi:hypothetical protein